jgi:hypothetical protein
MRRGLAAQLLTLHQDSVGHPIHVVWVLPAAARRPAVLVTAYPPDPNSWDSDFRQRRSKMTKNPIKLIHEGKYAAQVDLHYSDDT